MTLNPRQPRPLARDTASLRDDRLFIVACDDTFAPKQYFDFFRLTRIQIHVVPTTDGTSAAASHVLRRLLRFDHEKDDERWMLLDTDHCVQGTHLASFLEALGEAQRQGIKLDWVCCPPRATSRKRCARSWDNTTRQTSNRSTSRLHLSARPA